MKNKKYEERMTMVRLLLGDKCGMCGTTKGPFQIDHKDPLTKSFDISKRYSCKLPTLIEESKKCWLLCEYCHKLKTKSEKDIINTKKNEFLYVTDGGLNIYGELLVNTTLDMSKKNGREFYETCMKICEIRGITLEELMKENHEIVLQGFRYWLLMTGKAEERTMEIEEELKIMEIEDVERYEKVKGVGEKMKREFKNQSD